MVTAQNPGPEVTAGYGAAVVSVDLLRHPIPSKVLRLLMRAMQRIDAGDHETAIVQLEETVSKYPESAPYVDNLPGVEYVKVSRFHDAVASLERAASLLSRDAMTHYNFGLALICAGENDRAEQEIRRAIELDPGNSAMRRRLQALAEQR